MGAIASSTVHQVLMQRNSLSGDDFGRIGRVLTTLLAALEPDIPRWPEVAHSAFAVVRAHSDDPALTPTTLAHRLGWSLRHVQAVLATVDTTPSDLIRECRLARARSRLGGSSDHYDSIAAIALASGFGSVSTFNAAFRARYGVSPSELRSRQ